MQRVEVVELCIHGKEKGHVIDPCNGPCLIPQDHDYCDGGKRRVLTEGEFLLIEDIHDLPPAAWRVLNAAAAFGHPGGSVQLWKELRAALRGDEDPLR